MGSRNHLRSYGNQKPHFADILLQIQYILYQKISKNQFSIEIYTSTVENIFKANQLNCDIKKQNKNLDKNVALYLYQ